MTAEIKTRKSNQQHFKETEIQEWFLQMFEAIDYLHQSKVLHRDLKTSNIFISKNGSLKIGDFGIAKVLENSIQKAQTVVGTPYYMSPEICQNQAYSFKSDVWSLGCILFEMCTLKRAFEAGNLLSLVTQIIDKPVECIQPCYSPELNDLVQQMLQKDPEQRPSIRELKKHPFLRGRFNSSSDGESELKGSGRLGTTARMNICSFKAPKSGEQLNNTSKKGKDQGDRTSLNSVDKSKEGNQKTPGATSSVQCFAKEKSLNSVKNQLKSETGSDQIENNLDVTFETQIFGKKTAVELKEVFSGNADEELEESTKQVQLGK